MKVFEKTALTLKAYNHKQRQLFLQFIREQGSVTVTELYQHFHMEQSLMSQHLSLLRLTGLVSTEKRGKFRYYSVNEARIQQLRDLCLQINQTN